MINLMIADDHPVVREGLKRIITDCADIQLAGEMVNGDEVLRSQKMDTVDVLLLDISMPGLDYLDLIQRLMLKKSDLRVLVLSIHTEEHFAKRALNAGAAGYLTKDRSAEELADAIRHVNRGRTYITPSIAEKLAEDFKPGYKKLRHDMLSTREYQIFIQLATGMRTTDIANEMALSPKTINTYRTRIYQKMKFKSNMELVRYALENKIVD